MKNKEEKEQNLDKNRSHPAGMIPGFSFK